MQRLSQDMTSRMKHRMRLNVDSLPRTLSSKTRRIRLLFRVGIVAKGVDGLLEIIGGLMLLVVSPELVRGAAAFLTAHELSEDPDDWLANSVRHLVTSFSHDTERFAAAYLIGHGAARGGVSIRTAAAN